MSFDLMVFEITAVPRDRAGFMEWYGGQTKWGEAHEYDDPKVSSSALSNWFKDMINFFPMMNGPYAADDFDHPNATDYSIGKDMIYMAFSWACSEESYSKVRELAEKHKVGFFDVSSGEGEIIFPMDTETPNAPKSREIDAVVDHYSEVHGNKTLGSLPEIRKTGVDILAARGFIRPVQDGSYLFVYQELEANRVCFRFQLKHSTECLNYSAACTFVSNEIGNAINFITGEENEVFPRSKGSSLTWRGKLNSIDSFKEMLEKNSIESIEFANRTSYKDSLDDLLSTLDRPGSHQLWHIAALACTNNTDAINELLNKITAPDRGGLFPFIKQDHLELALEFIGNST